jgi:hypothetical protein
MELGACIVKGRTATDFAGPSSAAALDGCIVTKNENNSRNMLQIFAINLVLSGIIVSLWFLLNGY